MNNYKIQRKGEFRQNYKIQAKKEFRNYLLVLKGVNSYEKLDAGITAYEHQYGRDGFIVRLQKNLEKILA